MVSGAKSVAVDWDGAGMPEAPAAPETIKQAGLTLSLLNELLLRVLYTRGAMLGLDLARFLCLPFKVVERMALTGDRVDAHYLERLGAIQSVVPPAKVLEEAFRIADNLASKSPTMAMSKTDASRWSP